MMELKKTQFDGFYKDPETNVIINKNNNPAKAARMKSKQIDSLSKDVEALKDDISEIKDLLKKVLKQNV